MKLRSTTKMALQAALAILITEMINRQFNIDRGYWATLTAMAVTTQTWADSIKRSYERVLMTIIGGIAGTLLYLLIPDNQQLILCLLLIFVFFTVYLIQIYYLFAVFSLTCFVVFLFALIGDWNFILLRERIMDTILGVVVALVVSAFFLPAKTNLNHLFIDFLEKIRRNLNKIFQPESLEVRQRSSQALARDLQKIQKNAQAIRYELILRRGNRSRFHKMLKIITNCTHYTSSLVESSQWLTAQLHEEDRNKLKLALESTDFNLRMLIKRLKKEEYDPLLPTSDINALIHQAISENPKYFAQMDSEALVFFNMMYFLTRLNKNLHDAG